MQTVLLVIHLMLAVALIGSILLQRSEGGALGIGGGGGGGFMTGRGTANALTRLTAVLATGFFISSILLTLLARFDHNGGGSLIDTIGKPAATAPARGAATTTAPAGSATSTAPMTAPATTTPATTAPKPNSGTSAPHFQDLQPILPPEPAPAKTP